MGLLSGFKKFVRKVIPNKTARMILYANPLIWPVLGTLALIDAIMGLGGNFRGNSGSTPDMGIGAHKNDFEFNFNSEEKVLPAIFGRVRVDPHFIWSPKDPPLQNFNYINLRWYWSTNQNILRGFRGSCLYALCERCDRIHQVWVGDILAYDGGAGVPTTGSIAEFSMLVGRSADQYGSNPPNDKWWFFNGGQTTLDGHYGTQGTNVRRQSVRNYTVRTTADGLSDPVPYKGTALLYCNDGFIGDSVSSYPILSCVLSKLTLEGVPFSAGKMAIGPNVNPAHLIYHLMHYLGRIPATEFDSQSFEDAGDIFFAEVLGVSIQLTAQVDLKSVIDNICQVIGANVYTDEETGLVTMKAIRFDYDPNSIPELNQDDVDDPVISGGTWSDVKTQLDIVYTSASKGWKSTLYTLRNDANFRMAGRRLAHRLDFSILTELGAVKDCVNRAIPVHFYPIQSLVFKIPVDVAIAEGIKPASVFKYSDDRSGLVGQVFRVVSLEGGVEGNDVYTVTAVEDIFQIGVGDVQDIPEGDAPPTEFIITDPCEPVLVFDSPAVAGYFSHAWVVAGAPATGNPATATVSFDGSPVGDVPVCPVGYLKFGVAPGELSIQEGPWTVEDARLFQPVVNTEEAWTQGATIGLLVGNAGLEFVYIREIEAMGGGEYRLHGIIRALEGTQQSADEGNALLLLRTNFGGGGSPNIVEPFADLAALYGVDMSAHLAGAVDVTTQARGSLSVGPASTAVSYSYGYTAETPLPVEFDGVILDDPLKTVLWRTFTRRPRWDGPLGPVIGGAGPISADVFPAVDGALDASYLGTYDDGIDAAIPWGPVDARQVTLTGPDEITIIATASGRFSAGVTQALPPFP